MLYHFSRYFLLFLLLISGCDDKQTVSQAAATNGITVTPTDPPPTRIAAANLTEDYAKWRAGNINSVEYDLSFDLTGNNDTYTGTSIINFNLNSNEHPITIDFTDGTVNHLSINNQSSKIDYNNWFITVPTSQLKLGNNTVVIEFSHKYSKNGSGLHRFTDPVDQRNYLYSDFQPYNTNRMFPCFDQPDLKASYQVEVDAPKNWQVVSFVKESSIKSLEKQNRWTFTDAAKTRFSTYIFSLHAGEYKIWTDNSTDIPLRLMARQSLAQFINPELWFNYTKQGFDFFQNYFAIPYPYTKYDQLIVPDFNAGAMENVAAVTFSEFYVFQNTPSRNQRARLANVILHEMAHMWFGNLVTMKWWNGLWLNESFATYMANLALAKATEFNTDTWQRFYTTTKQAAYRADQWVTTHPIELPIIDTNSSFANFDLITYNKGASVLKQLSHYLDEEIFRQGVSQYLQKYAISNTTLQDFTDSLGQVANEDLDFWSKQWLYQESLNTVSVNYECANNKLTAFKIKQYAADGYNQLRTHRLQIGLYRQNKDNTITAYSVLPITVQGAQTSIYQAVGQDCPQLVYPNHDDWGFVKVQLDEKTLSTVTKQLENIQDSLLRSMFWQSLWDSVLDAQWSLFKYIDLTIDQLPQETDIAVLRQGLFNLESSFDYLTQLENENNQIRIRNYFTKIENFLWSQLNNRNLNNDLTRLLLYQFSDISISQTAMNRLKTILGNNKINTLTLSQRDRWHLLIRLNSQQENDNLVNQELQKDASDYGKKQALQARSSRFSKENKEKWLNIITNNPDQLGLAKLRQVMRGFWPNYQSLDYNFVPQILAALKQKQDLEYLSAYSGLVVPLLCNQMYVDDLQQFLDNNELSTSVRKNLLVKQQETKRCVNIASKL